jgi:two-component system sensor histidine kinase DctS
VIIDSRISNSGRISIVVEDSGCGVPEDVDVFKLFETTKPEGTGIGLAVAKQIIASHGGVIDYQPRLPRGTVFRMEFPIDGPARPKTHRGDT